ncbi:3-isopropylmalate dehydrogenase [Alicyclobacillus cycloheptanicus]|uniref:3-isopropylmalate dehydrogenase n=1 Tax=Alicyclobacillus cycloheptanicus TaxID=1457 RepID=A0ABT9XFJ0_9BACL|nr:3-isopropylmalate dehydrogenase [Alicyclobacillus cycloheptanicus]MDQ0188957.1 3-isopropylmalate dehydrogenase [Alicyclobacillus cycloheptanicus]WDM01694.1 3-isopropylmalate dehydrogenase [Alicyclobacillus cycloheptanicus]
MNKHITVLPGDGIGPEVTAEAQKLLEEVAVQFGHTFEFTAAHIGGAAIDAEGTPLPEQTVARCKASDAVLLGAVGAPKYDRGPASGRPEAGLLGLRKALDVFANLRPITVFPPLAAASPLKDEVLTNVDFVIVRELTGGLYFGTPRERIQTDHGLEVVDTLRYSEQEIERILRLGYQIAQQRGKRLTSVDKANVLESSRVWRETAERLHAEYPDVELNHLLVDNAAMQIVKDPGQFDVIVTENLFGDILSDEGAMITGSIGMLPSASLGAGGPGLYEPVHGSAPDIAGKGIANPLASFLSAAMMLRHSFGMFAEADAVEQAVQQVLADGLRTADIAGPGDTPLSTAEMGEAVRTRLRATVAAK